MLKIIKLKVFGVQYVLKLYGGSNPARERVIFRRQGEEVACIHCIHATTEFSTLWQVVKEDTENINGQQDFPRRIGKIDGCLVQIFL